MTPLLMYLLAGCGVADLLDLVRDEPSIERNCKERTAWYPDEDGDGLGENTAVYLGCDAPEGWVSNADDAEPTDSGNTDSGETDSGNTDSGETDSGTTDSGDVVP